MFSFISAGFLFSFFIVVLDFITGLSVLPFLKIITDDMYTWVCLKFSRETLNKHFKIKKRWRENAILHSFDKPNIVKLYFYDHKF